MSKHRVLHQLAAVVMGMALMAPQVASQGTPQRPAPQRPAAQAPAAPRPAATAAQRAPAAERAGAITALLPTARVTRGAGRAAVTEEARRGYEVRWNDLVRTERGGRARITLSDQSILSVGSQAELRIVRHDARTQQTSLQLSYGRVRAEVAARTRQGGRFELRTPTAVAGVIGTSFGVDSSVGESTFICLDDDVEIANIDPEVVGAVTCANGMTTTVKEGAPPTPLQPATPEQIQELLESTEPALMLALSPAAGLAGETLSASASGDNVQGTQAVTVTGEGVAASLQAGATASTLPLSLVVAANAAEGPRILTFTRPDEDNMAAIFQVVGAPTGTNKQSYLDAIGKLLAGYMGELESKESGLRQVAGQKLERLEELNRVSQEPVRLEDVEREFEDPQQRFGQSKDAAKSAVENEKAQILRDFESEFDKALNDLKQRAGSDDPPIDDIFEQEVKTAFDKAVNRLRQSTGSQEETLTTQLVAAKRELDGLEQKWAQHIVEQAKLANVPPTPAIAPAEGLVELGAEARFDAGRSRAAGDASVVSYQWALCGPSYRPAQFGVVLPGTDAACVPLSGFTASEQEFLINSCTLGPGDYAVRLLVTDSENRRSAMDARLSVISPGYDDPQQVLQNLADAYTALQTQRFLSYFDEVAFSGFTALQENVRKTFEILNSMDINLRISQATISCNEANLRADWEQKYTFDGSPGIVFSQTSQLTVRMQREPGRGWFISDFQGDNGTVQGLPPGPAVLDGALPDLELLDILVGVVNGGPPIKAPPAGAAGLTLPGGGFSHQTGVGFGPQVFTAVVRNTSDSDLTQQAVVRFSLLDAAGMELTSAEAELLSPLAAGESANVSATLNIPELTPGVSLTVRATVNPGCVVPERNCDAANTFDLAIIAGLANYVVSDIQINGRSPLTGMNALQVGEPLLVSALVTNTGQASPAGTLTVTFTCVPDCGEPVGVQVPAPAAGQTVAAVLDAGTVEGELGPPFEAVVTAEITTDIQEASTADNVLSVPVELFDFALGIVPPSPTALEQNIMLGVPAVLSFEVLALAREIAIPIPITAAAGGGATAVPSDATVVPGAQGAVVVNALAGTATPGNSVVTISGTNQGVQRTAQVPVRLFQAMFESTNFPLNSFSDPVFVPRESDPTDVVLRLVSGHNTDHGPVQLSVLPVPGFTLQLSSNAVNPNEEFELSIAADLTTQNLVTTITLRGEIPGSVPPVVVEHTLFVLPSGTPDLGVTLLTPPRDLSAEPWIVGEALTFFVTVQNFGNAPVPAGTPVSLLLDGVVVGSAALPAMAPGAVFTPSIKAIADDRGRDGSSATLQARVAVPRAGDGNLQNNSLDLDVGIADWFLDITGAGTNDVPLGVVAGGFSLTSVEVKNANTGGPVNGNFTLVKGVVSTLVDAVIATPDLAGPALLASAVTVSVEATAASGEYLAQVIAQIKDGAVVTAQRQATIQVRVGTGVPLAAVGIVSSAGNTDDGSPVQLNGPLPEEVSLTAIRDACPDPCPGTVDLQFTDSFNITAQPQQVRGLPFNSPHPVRFRGLTGAGGQMMVGFSAVTVSATAVVGVPALVSPDPSGSQQTSLYFQVGDLGADMTTCAQAPPGMSAGARVDLFPIGGFNAATLNWTWVGLPSGISVTPASGSSSFTGNGYPGIDFLFTNTGTPLGEQLAEVLLAVTISNSLGSATKTFPFILVISNDTNCSAFGGLRLPGGVQGTWAEGGFSGGSASLRSMAAPRSSGLPDLQVASADVSYSPSVPAAGDTVEVRFRVRNAGDADATETPVGLRVDGVVVASDVFDVRAGSSTLGVLHWSDARRAEFRGVRSASGASEYERAGWEQHPGAAVVEVVVDPYNTTKQKTSTAKSAALTGFLLREAGSGAAALGGRAERVLLELDEGACVGFRFSAGMGATCTSADVEMTVVDLGQGRYTIASQRGVADLGRMGLGASVPDASVLRYDSEAVLVPGHTYAVQLPGGRQATFTVQGIRSPMQLEVRARQVFGRSARDAAVGDGTDAPMEAGEVSGSGARLRDARVYLDIVYRAQ